MQIDVHEDKKLVCIWLTGEESANDALREKLEPLYGIYRKRNYTVALYRSGERDLAELTGELLRYNRKRLAEREVQAEKRGTAPRTDG